MSDQEEVFAVPLYAEVAKFASRNDGGDVTVKVYGLPELGEFAIWKSVLFSNPNVMGGLGVSHALSFRVEDWPALRAAIDEMLTPKPDKHAPLYAAMRKTPR